MLTEKIIFKVYLNQDNGVSDFQLVIRQSFFVVVSSVD